MEEVPERRAVKSALTSTWKNVPIEELSTPIHRPGSLLRMQRIFAYCLRFITNARASNKANYEEAPTDEELRNGLVVLLRNTQLVTFNKEYQQLRQGTCIDRSSKLITLQPFMDDHGLIRVGGRLRHSELGVNSKHPILLPKRSQVSQLILETLHRQHMHVGPQALMALSRDKYWIVDARRACTEIVHKCIRCFRSRPQQIHQLMGDLPGERVKPTRAFYHTGVDFAGPLKIHSRIRGRAPNKGYVAVFVCFTTKAVHLEVVCDLTTEAFLNALKRFVSRRGCCSTISCDNATNFVGAKAELSRLNSLLESQQLKEGLQQYCQEKLMKWRFIPPRSPHFGGLWEAAVKSAKQLLIRYTGMATLTYEELNTTLAQIEAILNSRPITPMSSDPNDLEALTPGHFLIGEPLCALPEPCVTEKRIEHLKRFQRLQFIQQQFWKRWSEEYLTQLQGRSKWKDGSRELSPGMMVLMMEENQPPLKWPLGRLGKVYRGEDNVVRVVEVRTNNGVYKRAVTKICPLPHETNSTPPMEQQALKEKEAPSALVTTTSKRSRNAEDDSTVPILTMFQNPSKRAAKTRRIDPINANWLANPVAMKRRTPAPQPTKTTPGRLLLNTLLIVLCCIYPTTATQPSTPISINQLNSSAGIYFEGLGRTKLITDAWNIVVYHNTTTYFRELEVLQLSLQNMSRLCKNTLYYTTNCRTTLSELEYQYQNAIQMNEVMRMQNHERNRRSPLDIIGTVANKLFGIVDREQAEQFNIDIKRLGDNQKYQAELNKRQKTVLQSTLNIIERDEKHTNSQLESLNDHIASLQRAWNARTKTLDETRAMLLFNSMVSILSLSFARYQRIQTALIDAIMDAHHGKISTRILTPSELTRQLDFIKPHVPDKTALPSERLGTIYSLARIKTRVMEGGIIFNINVPLVHDTPFELYSVIPLPIPKDERLTFVKPTTEYIAVTPHRDQFVKFTANDLKECEKSEDQMYICPGKHPIYTYKETNAPCEMEFFNHAEMPYQRCTLITINENQVWIQLHTSNTWIFSTLLPQTINAICGTKVYPIQLNGQGELTMTEKCVLETKVASIHSFSMVNTSSMVPFIPFTNISHTLPTQKTALTMTAIQPLVFEKNQPLNELRGQLAEPTNAPDLSSHDIHQFSVSYAIVLLLVSYAIFRYWKRRQQQMTPKPIAPQMAKADERFTVEVS